VILHFYWELFGGKLFLALAEELVHEGELVNTGHWQALEDVPHTNSYELQNVIIGYPIPGELATLREQLQPNLPWAEHEFEDRTAGEPYNPHPHVHEWPWFDADWRASEGGQYSHTYAERFWPKYAGNPMVWPDTETWGLRFRLGDLKDVVEMLIKYPTTRQAYLPVWFPEDTGAVHGERVPCTLGYHFMARDGKLNVNYFIRSCDFLRYLRDDMYLACRLGLWMADVLRNNGKVEESMLNLEPGTLTMFISSLHVFQGDMPRMRRLIGADQIGER